MTVIMVCTIGTLLRKTIKNQGNHVYCVHGMIDVCRKSEFVWTSKIEHHIDVVLGNFDTSWQSI